MPLPFKVEASQTAEVGTKATGIFEVPKYESVTSAEELAFLQLRKELATESEETEGGWTFSPESLVKWETGLAHLVLRRIDRDISPNEVKELPSALVNALAQFFLNERNGWKEPEGNAPKSTGRTTKKTSKPTSQKSSTGSAPVGPSDSE